MASRISKCWKINQVGGNTTELVQKNLWLKPEFFFIFYPHAKAWGSKH